jgi:hypothetical protein
LEDEGFAEAGDENGLGHFAFGDAKRTDQSLLKRGKLGYLMEDSGVI